MNCNAITVSNEIIKEAKEDGASIIPLRLMKLTYMAYGFGLALLNDGVDMIDPRFDKVEAWRLGPVIPSVYHTFKHYCNMPITELGQVAVETDNISETSVFNAPELGTSQDDADRLSVIKYVWRRYKGMSAGELVEILHQDGTPWSLSYRPGSNREIPRRVTKQYYDLLMNNIYDNVKRQAGSHN